MTDHSPTGGEYTQWTAPQAAAIEHVFGDLLVSAAAGSGKTAVLAERCARLVCEGVEGGCGVEGLLVLTFTEAAANEMRERIAGAIRKKLKTAGAGGAEKVRWLQRQAAMVERATISTLHAFCARVLRQHFSEAKIDPAFELMDEDEARLIRDHVLDELLARWHALEPTSADATAFADFFEAYAEGRDGNCREMILRVYFMLASTENPQRYVEASRENYRVGGSAAMVNRFVRDVVAKRLGLLELTIGRACEDVAANAGTQTLMFIELKKAVDLIEWARGELEAKGSAAMDAIQQALAYKWPICKTLKDVPDFEGLKKRTWERVKKLIDGFCKEVLSADVGEMRRDMQRLAGPLETLLALVEDFAKSFTAAKRARIAWISRIWNGSRWSFCNGRVDPPSGNCGGAIITSSSMNFRISIPCRRRCSRRSGRPIASADAGICSSWEM